MRDKLSSCISREYSELRHYIMIEKSMRGLIEINVYFNCIVVLSLFSDNTTILIVLNLSMTRLSSLSH